MYAETTHQILVSVHPVFLEEQSDPEAGRYLWAYHIRIENQGQAAVQLLTRYWKITDANGRVQEVRGDGVVGEQPVIEPGGAYEYSSGCPLDTPSGFMVGSYDLETENKERITVGIPLFSLDSPHAARQIH